MSCFEPCEFCDKIAANLCNCSSTPRFCCNEHIPNHMRSNEEVPHPLEVSLVKMSEEEIDLLKQAARTYQFELIRKAISQRNNIINSLLQKIRRVEQDCSSIIECALNGEMKQTVNQLVSVQFLPLYSSSSFVKTLVSLKKSNEFSLSNVSEQISFLFPEKTIFSSQSATNSDHTVKDERIKDPEPQWELSYQITTHTGNLYLGSENNREITCIAVSDCNRYFASASLDKTIKIWDDRSSNLVRSLEGHSLPVTSVSFLVNKIVSGSVDKTIKIWEEGRCIETLFLHSHVVTSVCVSSSKRFIASGSADKTIRVFDIENNRSLHTLRSHSDSVTSVVFSGDDREIISGSRDRSIKVWNTETGELFKTLNRHDADVLCVRTLGNLIVSSSLDKTIMVGERDREESLVCLQGHTDFVTAVDICNKTIASIGKDSFIKVWDLERRQQIQSLEGHRSSRISYIGYWYIGSLKIIEEGQRIVSGGADGRIKVWRRGN